MRLLCLSAANILHKEKTESTSYKICEIIIAEIQKKISSIESSITDLRDCELTPCTGCGRCYASKRCAVDSTFNQIYEYIISSDLLFIVSPHYAPIPAKLCMILEKMEQITFLHWGKDNSYKSEVHGIVTGVISHGGGSDWALKSYKCMVNDTIANALDTIQLKLIPLDREWNTGIALPIRNVKNSDDSIFPIQEYNWRDLTERIRKYIEAVIKAL